ncbi:protein ELF4-LIKE 1-like [Impatiens glandulifera]|uniref:protein ELF4-LIKE 1-like n=1 Tax=Impatiens glandulifera TaxID=253017 RepID=UPI001FB12E96|nr:protein ELF4-LIKE 1-like [Impatiens glandulifera]
MDSNMEEDNDDSQTLERQHRSSFKRKHFHNNNNNNSDDDPNFDYDASAAAATAQGLEEDEHCDSAEEAWKTLNKSFRQVQSILDHNRVLIQLVNENHQSQLPHKLVNNVALIREINANIGKVASLYSDLSINFSNLIHQHKALTTTNKDQVNMNT